MRRQLGVDDGVSDVFVAEVVLQRTRVYAIIRQLEAVPLLGRQLGWNSAPHPHMLRHG